MMHDAIIEQVQLLALDALSETESLEVRAHIEQCPSCTALLAEYQPLTTQLLLSVPQHTAPNVAQHLRTRLQALRPHAAPQPTQPSIKTRKTRPLWQAVWGLPRWARLGAMAMLVLLLIGGTVWWWPPPPVDERAEYVKLRSQPGVVKVSLKGTEVAPEATGQVVIDAQSNKAYLVVWNLKKLSKEYTYQIWLVREGGRDHGGLLTVVDPKEAIIALKSLQPLTTYREVGLTVEPVRGSPGPTTPRVMGGALPIPK